LLEDTTITGGALNILDATNVELNRVTVDSGTMSVEPTLLIHKSASNIRIIDSTFTRPTGAPPRQVVAISNEGQISPTDVTFTGGHVVSNSTARGAQILVSNLAQLTMAGTEITFGGTLDPGSKAIQAVASVRSMDLVSLSGVHLTTPVINAFLEIASYPGLTAARAVITNTTARLISTYGLLFPAGTIAPTASLSGNSFTAPPGAPPPAQCHGTGCP
jgi:hypothetical protein